MVSKVTVCLIPSADEARCICEDVVFQVFLADGKHDCDRPAVLSNDGGSAGPADFIYNLAGITPEISYANCRHCFRFLSAPPYR